MASSGLRGPFTLTSDGIDQNVTRTSPGAYALGHKKNGKFRILYVGRSDTDVNDRLHDHIGKFSKFKFEYYYSGEEAFLNECALYHDFEPPKNKNHPDKLDGSNMRCPICGHSS